MSAGTRREWPQREFTQSFYYRKSLRCGKEMRQDLQKELGFINLHMWEVLCFAVIVLFKS